VVVVARWVAPAAVRGVASTQKRIGWGCRRTDGGGGAAGGGAPTGWGRTAVGQVTVAKARMFCHWEISRPAKEQHHGRRRTRAAPPSPPPTPPLVGFSSFTAMRSMTATCIQPSCNDSRDHGEGIDLKVVRALPMVH
jgi:hypothetical protein